MLPDFVIIGAQKAGSTALMRQLAVDPRVYLPFAETRYFRDPWYSFQNPRALSVGPKGLRDDVRRRGIKCPDLLTTPGAAARVHDALPQADLIAVLREPVSRAISAYYYYMQMGLIPVKDPDVGFGEMLDNYEQLDQRRREVLEFGLYGTYLPDYLALYPRAKLLILFHEDLRDEPAAAISSVFRFLGMEPSSALIENAPRDNTGVYDLRRIRFLQRRAKYLVHEFPGWPGTYLDAPRTTSAWLRDRALAATDRILLSRVFGAGRPQISPRSVSRLHDFYRDDVDKLEALIERDLDGWRATR